MSKFYIRQLGREVRAEDQRDAAWKAAAILAKQNHGTRGVVASISLDSRPSGMDSGIYRVDLGIKEGRGRNARVALHGHTFLIQVDAT